MEFLVLAALVVLALSLISARKRIRGLDLRLSELEKRVSELGTSPSAQEAPAALTPQEPAAGQTADETTRKTASDDTPKVTGAEDTSAEDTGAEDARAEDKGPADKEAEFGKAPPPDTAIGAAGARPAKQIGIEERFGTQWVVWVGGIALTLGGFFLLRYSIEQGWFGPGARVLLAAILAAALAAAGEFLRRNERGTGFAGISSAHIPSILTAAGTAIAFADVYAAYALYDFLDPLAAFVLLSVVALGTLAAALLYGPVLAGLGLVGAYLTPAIVSTDAPNYWALYVYLTIATAATLSLARIRRWAWLAITAVAGAMLWSLAGITETGAVLPHALYLAAGYGLVALLIAPNFMLGPIDDKNEVDPLSSALLSAYLAGATLLMLATGYNDAATLVFISGVAVTVAISLRTNATLGAVLAAALLVMWVVARWAFSMNTPEILVLAGFPRDATWHTDRFLFGAPLAVATGLAALFGASGFLAQRRCRQTIVAVLWSLPAVATPLVLLASLYWRAAAFETSLPFAAVALALAALFVFATEAIAKRPSCPGQTEAGGIFATGAVAALALALSLALEKGWLTIALSAMVPGIAWVHTRRPWEVLRWLASIVTGLVLFRVVLFPDVVGGDLGRTPIVNWLLYGYGVPAVAFAAAGMMLRRTADDFASRLADTTAVVFMVLLVTLEIHHFTGGGRIDRMGVTLAEIGLDLTLLLVVTIGLVHLSKGNGSPVFAWAAKGLALALLAYAAIGLGLTHNPLVTGDPVGGPVFNLVLLGYGLPAVMTAGLAYSVRNAWRRRYVTMAVVAALVLALTYVSLEIRTLFHGPELTAHKTTSAEQYTYSAVWLLFGTALLLVGIWAKSATLRACSAFVVGLTIVKVFVIDMADLTGILRALSFLGLGAVLIGIGWFYQRLLFLKRHTAGDGEIPDEG